MSKIKKLSDDERTKMKDDFKKAMVAAYEIFGNWAFRKADKYPERRKPISKALFEVWSVSLAKINNRERMSLIQKKKQVIGLFASLVKMIQNSGIQ